MHQEAFDTTKEGFITTIDHSFKTPIDQSVKALNAILEKASDNKELSSDLSKLSLTLDKLQSNVNNLLLLSRLSNDTFVPTTTNISLLSFFEAIAILWTKKAQEKGLEAFIYIDPNLPKSCELDAYTLEHALTQLLDNAVKFTPKGGSISLDVRQNIVDTNHYINCSVTDTGVGIVKAKLEKLIKPFGEPSNTGAGMGLSSTFYLLKKINSDLTMSSEIGEGSRFSFSLAASPLDASPIISHDPLFIGILQDASDMHAYVRQIFSYMVAIGMKIITIETLEDEKIERCQALIIIDKKFDREKKTKIRQNHPDCIVIPTFLDPLDHSYDRSKDLKDYKLQLPLLPSKLIKTFDYISKEIAFIKDTQSRASAGTSSLEDLGQKSKIPESKNLKILLVEDVSFNIKWTIMLLSRYDYDIDYAENGEIAVAMAKQKRYDLILMDIDMPIMNGIEATRLIKSYEKEAGIPYTPIVALTSHDQEGEREEILAQGLDEHLGKPLKLSELEDLFDKYHNRIKD